MMRECRKSRPQGFILVIVMIAILTMTFFLLTSHMASSMAVKISGNYSKTVVAFNIAEAGLIRARPLLENQDFSAVLANYQNTPLIPSTAYPGGRYSVTVADDERDPNPSPTVDGNHLIKVISTGLSDSGSRSLITTYVQIVGGSGNSVSAPTPPPGGESAVLMCGSQVSVDLEGNANLSGDNFDVPTTIVPCTGSHCNWTHTANTNSYDIISESPLKSCDGCSGLRRQENVGAAANCAQWKTLSNQLSALNGNTANVVVLTGSSYQGDLNTCANPKIIIISTTASTFEIKGNSSMCGTVVVASDTLISIQGTASVVGLMLLMGGNSTTKGISINPQGTSNFYGKIIFGSSAETNAKSFGLQGDATIKYSASAVQYGLNAINNTNAGGGNGGSGQLLTVGWEETY